MSRRLGEKTVLRHEKKKINFGGRCQGPGGKTLGGKNCRGWHGIFQGGGGREKDLETSLEERERGWEKAFSTLQKGDLIFSEKAKGEGPCGRGRRKVVVESQACVGREKRNGEWGLRRGGCHRGNYPHRYSPEPPKKETFNCGGNYPKKRLLFV